MLPAIMLLPPNHTTAMMHPNATICMSGIAMTSIFSAENCNFCTRELIFMNFSVS